MKPYRTYTERKLARDRAAYLLFLASCVTPGAAMAEGNPQHWPHYEEEETITTIAPMGSWIDDNGDEYKWLTKGCDTDTDCMRMMANVRVRR